MSLHHSEIEQWGIERKQLIDAADARGRDWYCLITIRLHVQFKGIHVFSEFSLMYESSVFICL